jgi:dynein heavy chain, axonemal
VQMAIKILDGDGRLNHEQLDFFLKGNLSLEKSPRKNPYPWFPENGWQDLMRLITLGQGSGTGVATVADNIEQNEASWHSFYELETPEASLMPNNLSKALTLFERLLVLRCVRMDRVTVRRLPPQIC